MHEVITKDGTIDGGTRRSKHIFSSRLAELCESAPEETLQRIQTTRTGLSEDQVTERQEQYGRNEVTHEKPPTWYQQLFHAFLTPFNGVLFAVSVVSLFSDVIFAAPEDRSFKTIIVLCSMVLLSTLLRFWQEFQPPFSACLRPSLRRTWRTMPTAGRYRSSPRACTASFDRTIASLLPHKSPEIC
jgi:P-type Mg2+ transporter